MPFPFNTGYKMKLLLITSSFPNDKSIGGIFIPDTIRTLNTLGVQVHVLTQNCDSSNSTTKTLWDGCDITYFAWKGGDLPLVSVMGKKPLLALSYMCNGIRIGRKIAKEWKPDFLFAEWLVPAGLMAFAISKLTGIPYAARALGSDVIVAAKKSGIKQITRMVAKKAAVLFADGFDLCKKTSELAGGKDCHFAATARKLENKKSDFLYLDDTGLYTFCSLGRLHQVKGFDFLIKSCSILKNKNINFRCYIVGDGEEKENLKYLINSLAVDKNVILTGRLEDGDVSDLFRHVDCIVIPSLSESIPLVLSEGVNAHKPLIVTNVGDMGYLAEKYKLGYVVEKENSEDLAKALLEMSNAKVRTSFYNKQNYDELSSILSPDSGAKAIYEKIKGLKN
jgi:glycosyltransferase involved in cell wall biosynthesis